MSQPEKESPCATRGEASRDDEFERMQAIARQVLTDWQRSEARMLGNETPSAVYLAGAFIKYAQRSETAPLEEAVHRCANHHGDDALLDAPCIFCGYSGAGYWQKGTHAPGCRWREVGSFDDRRKSLIYRNPAPNAAEPMVPNGEYREIQLGGSARSAIGAPVTTQGLMERIVKCTSLDEVKALCEQHRREHG